MLLPNLKLVAIVLLAGFVAGWMVRGWKEGAAQKAAVTAAQRDFQAKLESRDSEHVAQLAANAERELALAAQLDALQSQADQLRVAASRVPLTRTVVERINESCSCSAERLSVGFGLCFGAAISGGAEAITACEASGSNAAVPTGR